MAGDIFPDLLTKYAGLLSLVVADVLNAAYAQEIWPDVWKTESVSIIPKVTCPENLNEVRNISCTPVLSKVMEFFVLERLKKEIQPRSNQYGGITGCGTTHYLLQAWNDILESLDDDESAVTLTSIDFAKAFNTMGHQACVEAVRNHGTSDHSTRLVTAFLLNRQMRFRVGDVFSSPRLLKGGSPQGTLLGNFMFVITTDRLEEKPPPSCPALDRTTVWDPAAALGSPVRRRPSAVLPGLHGVVTSSPVTDRDRLVFAPDMDDVPEALECDDHSTFEYFRPLREPFNRINDTRSRTLFSVSTSRLNDANPRPTNWKERAPLIVKYVDDFLGCEKLCLSDGSLHFSSAKTKLVLRA